MKKQTLVIRMTSLGDVVLATAGLSLLPENYKVDWLVSSEMASLLEGHSRISRVWGFNRRKEGLLGWLRLGLELRRQGYSEIIDLHRSLRTKLLRLFFLGSAWRSISKPRWRRWGLFVFKGFWPKRLRPKPWVPEFSNVLLGFNTEAGRPDLGHLLPSGSVSADRHGKYKYAVMPDSAWAGKCWDFEKFGALVEGLSDGIPVIFGAKGDERTRDLIDLLLQRGVPHKAAVGLTWGQVAAEIADCSFFVGNDTGLAHVAEALGVPAIVLYGPTSPDLGFRPWRRESRSIHSQVRCSPCSTDGRFCYWIGASRYKCMSEITVEQVRGVCREVLRNTVKDRATNEDLRQ